MLQKLGFFVAVVSLTLPVWAGETSGAISGFVRSASGAPQMGAMVEVLGPAAQALTVFTDEHGFYSVPALLPGLYNIKATATAFLPTVREGLALRPGSKLLINLTLNTLFDAVKMAAPRTQADDDDWKWVLRSAANRPLLRMVDDPPAKTESDKSSHDLKGSLSFLAGSDSEGYGSSAGATNFAIERSVFSSDTVGLQGNVGYGNASPTSVIRASYSHRMEDGSQPQLALTMRNLPAPDVDPRVGSLQALALTTSDSIALGDLLELNAGSELQSIQFLGHVTAFRPFGSADVHLSERTVVEYRYATSEPNDLLERGFDSSPADLSESGPRMSMVGYASSLEHVHHHEVSISRHMGKTSVQLAAYYDRVVDPALTGVGEFATDGGMVLPDIFSGTFTYQSSDLKTEGWRLVVEHKVNHYVTATMDFSSGGVVDLERPGVSLADAQQFMGSRVRQSLAGKVGGVVPKTKTRWVASYRWTDGSALTPVDMFNTSAGRADPYLNLFFRQPLPSFFPGHMEAVVDLRNLLAQGYVPVLGHDGHTVYLVESAKAVRGGLNFTF